MQEIGKLTMRRIPADKLKPAAYNPRKDLQPGDERYERIKASLEHFSYVDPIIWNEVTGNIVGGHQRYKLLMEAGAKEIDVSVVHIESLEMEKTLNLALNKTKGAWEPKALGDLLQEMQDRGYEFMDSIGFSQSEISDWIVKTLPREKPQVNPDDVPDSESEFVQLGDIWQLGNHRMMCGDSTKKDDVSLLMQHDTADLIMTDPPYNVNYESADGKKIQNDKMSSDSFYQFLLDAFTRMKENSKPGATAYVFHADTEGLNFRAAFCDAGFNYISGCVWVKDSLVLGRSPYQWKHEPIIYGALPGKPPVWRGKATQTSVWLFDKPKRSDEHPTMKPVKMLSYAIENSSSPRDIVMDLFGGSGSTLIASAMTGRVCRTMELDPHYASVIVARFHEMYPDEPVLLTRDGVQREVVW